MAATTIAPAEASAQKKKWLRRVHQRHGVGATKL